MDEITEITLYQQDDKIRAKYSPTKLSRCLEEIRSGKLSCRKASIVYNIPRTTLSSKINGRRPSEKCRPGPEPTLGIENEALIEKWVLECADQGYPIKRSQLVYTIEYMIECLPARTRALLTFKGKPTKSWYGKFLKRHPSISAKKAEYFSVSRALVNESRIRAWFASTEQFLDGESLLALNDPSRVFNTDETAVWLNPAGDKVLARRSQVAYSINGNDDKINITVLFTVSASGSVVCPTAVYKGIRHSRDSHIPSGWHMLKTPKGWMTCDAFVQFLRHIFLPYIESNMIKRPVLLFLDGHVSHISLPAAEFCREFGIVLVCFLPAATHVLQPLDKAVFKSLKAFWRSGVDEFRLRKKRDVSKFDVPGLLQDVISIHREQLSVAILSGFRSCGIYPWDVNAIKYALKCKYADKVWWSMKDSDYDREVELFHEQATAAETCSNDIVDEEQVFSYNEVQPHETFENSFVNHGITNDHSLLDASQCDLESTVGYFPTSSKNIANAREAPVIEHDYVLWNTTLHNEKNSQNAMFNDGTDTLENSVVPTANVMRNTDEFDRSAIATHFNVCNTVEIGGTNENAISNDGCSRKGSLNDDPASCVDFMNGIILDGGEIFSRPTARETIEVHGSRTPPAHSLTEYDLHGAHLLMDVTDYKEEEEEEEMYREQCTDNNCVSVADSSQNKEGNQCQMLQLRKPLQDIVNVVGPIGKSDDIRGALEQVLIDYCPRPRKKTQRRKPCKIPVVSSSASIAIKKAALQAKEQEEQLKRHRQEERRQQRAKREQLAHEKKILKAAQKAELEELLKKHRLALTKQ